MSSRKIDMTGIRYGAVVALNDVGLCADGKYKWLCQCDCGKKFESSGSKIRSGDKKATLYWRLNKQHWPIEKALTIGAK